MSRIENPDFSFFVSDCHVLFDSSEEGKIILWVLGSLNQYED